MPIQIARPDQLRQRPLLVEAVQGTPTILGQRTRDRGRLREVLTEDDQERHVGATYYEVEVMLDECDADHRFRTLDYWARERLRNPNSRHVAVLVAEDLSGRYQTVIETLSQFLRFIGIEIKVLRLPYQGGVATIVTSVVAQPDDLVIDAGDESGKTEQTTSSPRDRAWWESNSSAPFVATVDEITKYCTQEIGPSRVDYSAQSYVSLKKGRRAFDIKRLGIRPLVDIARLFAMQTGYLDSTNTADRPRTPARRSRIWGRQPRTPSTLTIT